MSHTKPLSILLILVLVLFSCKKDPVAPATPPAQPHDTTSIPPPVTTPKLHMSLSYLITRHTIDSTKRTNYELYISEAGGKMLLDTLVDYNRTITADLATSAKYVDVTVIFNLSPLGAQQTDIHSYKTVDLANWKNLPLSDSVPGQTYLYVTGVATMQVKNVGAPAPLYWQFMTNEDPGPAMLTGPGPWFSPEGTANSNTFTVTYPWEQDAYAYIGFLYNGLYKIHKINAQNDTVDFSKPDTGKRVSFNWSSQYDIRPRLFGYTDTNNRSRSLLLAPGHAQFQYGSGYEMMYPANKNIIQKYDLLLTGLPTDYTQAIPVLADIRWTWLDTIPVNVPFLDASYFTVNFSTPDSFSVTWPKVKPTFYVFSASTSLGNFLLTAPGDSTKLDPEFLLAHLVQGKILKGMSPAMFINGFQMIIDDDPNYQSYMLKQGDVMAANKRPMSNQKMLTAAMGFHGGAATTKFLQSHAMLKR